MRQRQNRAVGRWLVALLLLPILLGVVPPAQLSAAQALARDLALSICSPNGPQDHRNAPASHDGQCVLCTVGCATCAPIAPASATAALIPAPPAGPLLFTAGLVSRPLWSHWRDGAPPRGPPPSLSI